jgi:tRNA A-37 threonylcarbamoyl transferase component Bud32
MPSGRSNISRSCGAATPGFAEREGKKRSLGWRCLSLVSRPGTICAEYVGDAVWFESGVRMPTLAAGHDPALLALLYPMTIMNRLGSAWTDGKTTESVVARQQNAVVARPLRCWRSLPMLRLSYLCVVTFFWVRAANGQHYPFLRLGGADAPKGCLLPFQDSHGGLWLAGCETGDEGFFYFDGTRFMSPLKDVFPKGIATGMAEDSEGGIWVASTVGLNRVYRGHLQSVVDGEANTGIARVSSDVFLAEIERPGQDPAGEADLVRITRRAGSWRADTVFRGLPEVKFRVDSAGHVLYPCKGGFCEFEATSIAHWQPGTQLAIVHHAMPTRTNYYGDKSLVWKDRFGCVWMRSRNDASYQCPSDPRPITLPPAVASVGAPQIFELGDGSIVIASLPRVAIGRPGKFRLLTVANGYPGVGYALITSDGNLLLGNANGLFLLPLRLALEFWFEQDGLDGNTWSVLRLDGNVFAISGDSIRELDSNRTRWRLLTTLSAATHLIAGPGGTILAGSHTDGVVQLDVDGHALRRSAPTEITMLARTPDGQFWATGSGVYRINFSGKDLILAPAGAPDPQGGGMDMKVDHDGSLWSCYAAGLVHEEATGWRILSSKDGNLQNHCNAFAIDGEGEVWYSYEDLLLLSMIQETKEGSPLLRNFQDGGELGAVQSHFLDSDKRGWLWRGSADGVYLATPEQARQGEWLYLNRTDGLPAVDTNQKSFFEDRDGSIWFGADNSVIHILPPADLLHPTYSPSVFVSGFSWNGSSPQMADLVDGIKAGSNITAYVGSLQFDRRNALRVRYRVLPDQPAWRESSSLDLALGMLPWGSHTIEVQGRIFTGPWSQTVSRSFTVLRPAGLTWPFALAYLVMASILAAGGYWLYRERKAEEVELLPNLAAWRLDALVPEAHQLAGAVLDSRFEVGKILARGGFANVMAGCDRDQKQRCAIKVFRSEVKDKDWVQRRFRQEVAALQQVRHPNVVSIYAHGVTPSGSPYLVMEFVEGKSLREVLENGALSPERMARLLQQLAGALDAIHRQGIWHRDLKPENVMIRNEGTPDEECVLIDFSIAIVKDADETLHGLSRAAGTFDYMAPEQAIGYAQSSSDVYSLAKVVIEMLTGRRLSQLLPDAALDLPDRVRELVSSLDVNFSRESIDTLASALEFDPGKRPDAAGAFAAPLIGDLIDCCARSGHVGPTLGSAVAGASPGPTSNIKGGGPLAT